MAVIAFPTDAESVPEATTFDVIYSVIAVITALFSAYTTFLGFSYDLPYLLSVPIAVIVGLGLLAMNFLIRDARKEGASVLKPLIVLLVIFVFSFISNTNAIYTRFLQDTIVADTQENAWLVFDSETSVLLDAIDRHELSTEAMRLQRDLDIARRNLKEQITDERNPGMGELAQRHLREINLMLGTQLTPLRAPAPGAAMADFESYADRLDGLIQAQFDARFAGVRSEKLFSYQQKIHELRQFYKSLTVKREYSRETTDLMKRDLEELEVRARSLLDFRGELKEINNSADEIGSFQYTWTNFANWIKPAAILLSILLGALLDLLTPLMSALLFKPNREYL